VLSSWELKEELSMTTAIYCRKSSNGKPGEADTVDTQEAELRKYAKDHGWNGIEVFRERGISAGPVQDAHRKVFYDDLDTAISSGRVDRVLAVEVDRISRYALAFYSFIERCKTFGVEVIATRSGTNLTDPKTSVLEIAIRAGLAGEESRIRRERQTSHRARLREAGQDRSGGRRKYGYEPDNATIRPAEAALIRDSVARIVAGQSLRSIAFQWRDAGVVTTRGSQVVPQTIRRCLLNTDLVDAETHERLVAILTDPARSKSGFNRRRFLLGGGVSRCGVCGTKLVPYRDRYVCRTNPTDGTNGCGATKIESAFLDETVVDLLKTGLVRRTLVSQVQGRGGETIDFAAIAGERAALTAKLNDIADAFADGTLTRDQARRGRERIEARIDKLSEKARDAGAASTAIEALTAEWRERMGGPAASVSNFDWWRALIVGTISSVRATPPSEGKQGEIEIRFIGANPQVAEWASDVAPKLRKLSKGKLPR
jgi:site-specific DNA recombinase